MGIYIWPEKKTEPTPVPLEEGAFAVSYSDPKWEKDVTDRAEKRKEPVKKAVAKKPVTKE